MGVSDVYIFSSPPDKHTDYLQKRSVSDRGEETPARKKTKVGDRNAKAFLPETEEVSSLSITLHTR